MAVTAVELGAGLAAVARRRLASFPSAEVLTVSFEDWEPRQAPSDAVVAFQFTALDQPAATLLDIRIRHLAVTPEP